MKELILAAYFLLTAGTHTGKRAHMPMRIHLNYDQTTNVVEGELVFTAEAGDAWLEAQAAGKMINVYTYVLTNATVCSIDRRDGNIFIKVKGELLEEP